MKKAGKKFVAHVVSHTHWDRAWYLPFEQFRIRLINMMEHLLSLLSHNQHFQHFTLDGQTVLLEDYLQIMPERQNLIKQFTKKGRLILGPWYVLADEYLVSGEALIRNLLIGHQIGSQFGPVMKVGYMPDSFGHVSQLPQILQGFGIDNFIFTRGLGQEGEWLGTEFYWSAADGKSKVLAIHQVQAYGNARALGVPFRAPHFFKADIKKALDDVELIISPLKKYANTNILLLNNGIDHQLAQAEITEIIEYVNKRAKDYQLVHSNFSKYIAAVKRARPTLKSIKGELHKARYNLVLWGKFSARMYLKQENEKTQTLLEKITEPLCVWAWLEGRPYPQSHLSHAWKTLIKNHPHDDICGCSVDSVHRDMMNRFARAQQVAGWLADRAKESLLFSVNFNKNSAWTPFLVLNSLNWQRSGLVKVRIVIPVAPFKNKAVAIFDYNGKRITASVTKQSVFQDKLLWGNRQMQWIEAEFLAEGLQPLSYRTYYIAPAPSDQSDETSNQLKLIPRGMENEFYRVKINDNGTLDIEDKALKRQLSRVHWFQDGADCGDEYDFSPLPSEVPLQTTSLKAKIKLLATKPYKITYSIKVDFPIPRELRKNRKAGVKDETILPIETEVTLYAGIKRIDFTTKVTNNVKDHRLRVAFFVPIKTRKVLAESKFDVIERDLKLPDGQDWAQPPQLVHHQERFCSINDANWGITFINKGLPEYEAQPTNNGTLFFQTLFRSVGWLSLSGLLTRKENAGPEIPAPEAQCLGPHVFEYAITTHSGGWDKDQAHLRAYEHNITPEVTCFWHRFRQLEGPKCLGEELSLLEFSPPEIIVSALKKAEERDSLMLRCYNLLTRPRTVRVKCYRPIKKAYSVRLNETRLKSLPVKNNTITFEIKPKQVMTIELIIERARQFYVHKE